MARPVRMPSLGQSSDEVRVVEWLRAEGDEVEVGRPLVAIETDKAELELESTAAGTLLRIVHAAGETVRAGAVVAWIGEPGEAIPEERVEAAPAVRKLAAERGVDLAGLTGSGPGGRILREDVLAATGDGAVPRHRQALAARLARSAAIPQFSVGVTVDMRGHTGEPVTALLLRVLAAALREHPDVNRLWLADGPRIRQLERADVGLAVAGDDTVHVVTIPEPDRIDPTAELDRIRAGGRGSGGEAALTLSNLGGVGVDRFTALLDPDQTAIVAAGRVTERPGVVDGRVEPVPQLELTLTADHRILDGVAAGRFLDTVRRLLAAG